MPAFDILRRLERAERAEAATARGLADQIVSYQQHQSRLAAILHSARTAAADWPRYGPAPGTPVELWQAAENARADALRQVRALMRASGADPGQFNQVLAQASQPTEADFTSAIVAAENALAGCERELAELERERSRRGRRLGELRSAIRAGQDWLRANGYAAEAA